MPTSQALGDLLSGAGGHTVDRDNLNAYITQGQALAGLRSSQTEEALLNAQRMRDEQDAFSNLEGAMVGLKGPDGNPMMTPSQAHLAALDMQARHGSAKDALEAVNQGQKNQAFAGMTDPNTPVQQRSLYDLALNANANPYQAVEGQLVPRQQQDVNNPTVFGTPVSNSNVDKNEASALLDRMKAEHPHEFQAGFMTPEQVALIAQYVRQNPSAAPSGRPLFTPQGAAVAGALTDPTGAAAAPSSAGAGPAPVVPPPPPAGQTGAAPTGAPGAAPPQGTNQAPSTTPFGHLSFKEQTGIRNDFANGVAARQVTSLNTMFQHSQLFDQIADQLHNGNFTPTNDINVLWQKVFGGSAPTNLATAGAFLGREAVRATVNSGAGTGEERELQVGPNASPGQLHDAASTLRSLAGGQLHSLNRRATRGGVDITQLLEPGVAQAYGLGSQTAPVVPPKAPGAPDPNDPLGIR